MSGQVIFTPELIRIPDSNYPFFQEIIILNVHILSPSVPLKARLYKLQSGCLIYTWSSHQKKSSIRSTLNCSQAIHENAPRHLINQNLFTLATCLFILTECNMSLALPLAFSWLLIYSQKSGLIWATENTSKCFFECLHTEDFSPGYDGLFADMPICMGLI